uniref:Uncharacterized protein n=1 Tax=Romanomermis culicivorax TaxID=13658 RepID=A0A915IKB1_ROMCU
MSVTCQPLRQNPWYWLCPTTITGIGVGFDALGMLDTLLMASRVGKSPCKSKKLHDQWPKHLHRNGAPQKDQCQLYIIFFVLTAGIQ